MKPNTAIQAALLALPLAAHGCTVLPSASAQGRGTPAPRTTRDAATSATTLPDAGNSLAATLDTTPGRFASSSDARLVLTITNRGTSPATFWRVPWESAILALAVHDARGQRVLTVPPPVPRPVTPAQMETLAPGASTRFTLSLNVFSPPLGPGRYTVSVRDPSVAAQPATFDIGP